MLAWCVSMTGRFTRNRPRSGTSVNVVEPGMHDSRSPRLARRLAHNLCRATGRASGERLTSVSTRRLSLQRRTHESASAKLFYAKGLGTVPSIVR